ncbi:MAG: S-layer homology domain-containing protein, partial [Candidatus Ornithomonoglobus sp.]
TAEDAVSGYAVNLGNYGVTYTYNLKIINNGHKDRYFTYAPTTGSKIIVYTDEKGKEPGYGLVKKGYYSLVREVMSVVKLPAGQTTEFSVNMILPVNYNGGMKNAFIILDKAEEIDFDKLIEDAPEREYVKPINGSYLSEYKDKLPADTLASFDGTLDCYEVINCGDFYAARWCEWDGSPNSYSASWWLCNHVYILDKDFNVTGYHTFANFPNGMSYNNGKVYVRTLTELWESENGTDWVKSSMKWLPEYAPEPEDEPEYTLEEALLKLGNVSAWAFEDMKTAAAYRLIPDDLLGMNTEKAPEFVRGITRGEFCGIAKNVIKYIGTAELPKKTNTEFTDSSDTAVCQLAALGVVNGYEDGTFRPENTITREEAAAILSRLLSLYTMNGTAEAAYSDSEDIQDWARESVGIMLRYGIMNGVDDTRFDPKGTYTIEQSVVTLLRAFNAITDNGYLKLPAIPSGGKYCTVYREGYRNGRIELAVYDTEEDSTLVNDNGVLSVSGSYTNDVKYYFSGGRWVQFESGYERISNNAKAVLWSSK